MPELPGPPRGPEAGPRPTSQDTRVGPDRVRGKIAKLRGEEDKFLPRALGEVRARIEELKEKRGSGGKERITDPYARFNLGLDGQSGRRVFSAPKVGAEERGVEKLFVDRFNDWQPTDESNLPKAPTHEPSDTLKAELAAPERVEDPKTGQRLNVLKLNWSRREPSAEGEPQDRTLIFLPQFTDKINRGTPNYRAAEVARQTGVQTLVMDYPSMGHSDSLTSEQRKGLTHEGYQSIAEAQLRIFKELGLKDIDLAGSSLGGFAAAEIARVAAEQYDTFGITVHNLLAIEPTGAEGTSIVDLASRFSHEGRHARLYSEYPRDPNYTEALGGSFGLMEKVKVGIKGARPDSIRYSYAMAQERLYENLRVALLNNQHLKVTIGSGTMSKISPNSSINQVYNLLNTAFPNRVRRIAFVGEPHAVMESAKRFGALVKSAINWKPRDGTIHK